MLQLLKPALLNCNTIKWKFVNYPAWLITLMKLTLTAYFLTLHFTYWENPNVAHSILKGKEKSHYVK